MLGEFSTDTSCINNLPWFLPSLQGSLSHLEMYQKEICNCSLSRSLYLSHYIGFAYFITLPRVMWKSCLCGAVWRISLTELEPRCSAYSGFQQTYLEGYCIPVCWDTVVLERWLAKGFRNTIRLNIISDIIMIKIKLQIYWLWDYILFLRLKNQSPKIAVLRISLISCLILEQSE